MGNQAIPENIETRLFINGEFTKSSDGKVVAKAYEATEDDTNRAVAAAKAAFPAWSALEPMERGVYFNKLAALIRAEWDEFKALEAMSMGKPVSGGVDAMLCAMFFENYSKAGYNIQGSTGLNSRGSVAMSFRQSYGGAASIILWNGPLIFLAMKLAPALITGNTMALRFASLVQKAGFPPGVVNVLSGYGKPSGALLASHMDVRVISFTGSPATSRSIQAAAANSNLRSVILELGGKSPCIVFEDADIPAAVEVAMKSMEHMSGQMCMMNSRIYVHETDRDGFLEGCKEFIKNVRIGDPLDLQITHGPQADKIQFDRVKGYLDLVREGLGKIALGGNVYSGSNSGFFIDPTILTNVPEDKRVMKEEIFGPVAAVNMFKTEKEVLTKANDTVYGFYASISTQHISRAMRFAKAIESGTVAINRSSPPWLPDMPFGGYKGSGLGREGYHHSLDHYLKTMTVLLKVDEQIQG